MNKKITVKKIIEICEGKLLVGNENLEISSYCKDSRDIKIGDLYLAIKGENVNGNDFVGAALNNGAIGAIVDDKINDKILEKYQDKAIIKVKDTIKAMQDLARYKRSLYNIPVIAVTGSVRKNQYQRYNI